MLTKVRLLVTKTAMMLASTTEPTPVATRSSINVIPQVFLRLLLDMLKRCIQIEHIQQVICQQLYTPEYQHARHRFASNGCVEVFRMSRLRIRLSGPCSSGMIRPWSPRLECWS